MTPLTRHLELTLEALDDGYSIQQVNSARRELAKPGPARLNLRIWCNPNRFHAQCADCPNTVKPQQGSEATVKGENRGVVLCAGCVDTRMRELVASGREC